MSFIQSLFPEVKSDKEVKEKKEDGKRKLEKTSWIESLYADKPIHTPAKTETKKVDNTTTLPVKEFIPTGEDLNQGYIIANKPKKKVMIEYLRKRVEELVNED
jgi:hypothetical protein